ncbi:MAG: ATP-binding protein [Actinomycetota bacterium]|nr:ATP-binding protein [Actinomycetota bacterium]
MAVDVAAMANDGGTLLYGVDEDDHGEPAVRTPIQLDGARERVDQIVRTCISEPPDIEIRAIPTEEDEGKGYLVVAVPLSPRAPHMVTVGKDNRYYGRVVLPATCH